MKAILISINPKWVAKILNGEKTIEIRKRFPSDYVGWVYIYCTKDRKQCLVRNNINKTYHLDTCYWDEFESNLNGKVVARFWCDKVEKFDRIMIDFEREDLKQNACISQLELDNYIKDNIGYAIHITNLEIFDKPKEIREFKYCLLGHNNCVPHNCSECPATKPLTRAPQSWCYIED